ncbi:LysM peptidoglycan-binding domain-containing protein [Psychromonas sp. KJ10-10]|uniref:lytic transglycosylase n=1 Tax=Psychromonas sp. KJ10-10 TaxID=3391823 RepID=UPI0039B36A73
MTVAEIQLLNPAFNHWATSPDGPHKLLIPTNIADEFNQVLNQTDKDKRIRWSRYKVRSGDSLSVIAQRYGTSTSVLKQINDINGSFIKVGQPLLIPIANEAQQDYLYSQAKRFEDENRTSKHKITHKVVEGDTLWDISRSYKVTTKEITKWNAMSANKTLRLGENLTIWKTTTTNNQGARKLTYHVRSGDSLGKIAQKFNVKTDDLVIWNQLHTQKYIRPGQKLLVFVEADNSRG